MPLNLAYYLQIRKPACPEAPAARARSLAMTAQRTPYYLNETEIIELGRTLKAYLDGGKREPQTDG